MNEHDIRPEWDDYGRWTAAPRWVAVTVDLLVVLVVGLAAYGVWGR